MKKIKIAVCQNKPVHDKSISVCRAVNMIEEATDNGAQLVLLPEIFYHPYEFKAIPDLEESSRETLKELQKCAQRCNIFLCTGSMVEREQEHRYNRSYIVSPAGDVLMDYSKIHLFDVDFKRLRSKESSVFDPGNTIQIVKTELATFGILICYDIRFPEMCRKLALMGAEVVLVPAAFNSITGPAHWHLLFRTRAMENQLFVAAASPARDDAAAYLAYGHSLVVDPWGDILVEADEHEQIIYADLDPEILSDVRSRLPLLKHRRQDLY